MKIEVTYILWIFLAVSCKGKKFTDEQEKRYDECKLKAIAFYQKLPVKQMTASERDSAKMLETDLGKMGLETFADKYHIKDAEINNFIESLCLSSEMLESVEGLNQELDENRMELDTSIENALKRGEDSVK